MKNSNNPFLVESAVRARRAQTNGDDRMSQHTQDRSKQRDAARKKANEVRYARADLKRELRGLSPEEGAGLLSDVFTDPPPFMRRCMVLEALTWLSRTGDTKAQRLMRAADVGLGTAVGDLTERQARDLGRCLRGLEQLVASELRDRYGWEYAA